MTDAYAYWRNALAGTFGPVHDGDAQPGFYRKRAFKAGPWLPVAIWHDGAKMVALVDGKPTDAAELWSWVCDKPITEAAYKQSMAGEGWPDEPKAPVLSNLPSDPREALEVEWSGEKEVAAEILATPITTKEQADQAAVWTKRAASISKKATDLHKFAKQPHLDAGRAVDDQWRDLKEEPTEFSKRVKRHLDAYLQEQDRIERERQRIAREEAARIQREAEEAARAAEATGDSEDLAEAERAADAAAAAEREAQARNSSAGRTGAKVALRTFVSAEIVDFDVLLMALKARPEIIELVQALANRAAKSGVTLPGMGVKEERRAA